MVISSSVGKKCTNARTDVKVIQSALSYFWRGTPYPALTISGKCDDNTVAAIVDYQERIQHMPKPDGQISSSGKTVMSLFDNIPSKFDLISLRGIMVNASRDAIGRYYKSLVTTMETRSIHTPLRRAHFQRSRRPQGVPGAGKMVPGLPMIRAIAATLTLAALAATAGAHEPREIHFAPGSNSATVSGAVVRGTRDIYSFSARKGQMTKIDVSAVESNAAITVWRPGARLALTADDDIEGSTLPGAGEGQDAQRWIGSLPETGRYIVVVGPTRGNATYQLRLRIGAQPSRQPAHAPSHPPK